MYQTINFCQFCDAFDIRKENFTYEGKRALFDYLERLEEDQDEDIELDIIALCCEFSEYKNLAEYQDDYNDCETIEDIENQTTVIRINDESFIMQAY